MASKRCWQLLSKVQGLLKIIFSCRSRKKSPGHNMLKVWNINSIFQTTIEHWKQHLQQDKQKTNQAAALNKHPFSLLQKMNQQKKAEIMWTLEVAIAKHSFRSCDNKSELYNSMFPDSQVAKTFACGKTKCTYLVCHVNTLYAIT